MRTVWKNGKISCPKPLDGLQNRELLTLREQRMEEDEQCTGKPGTLLPFLAKELTKFTNNKS